MVCAWRDLTRCDTWRGLATSPGRGQQTGMSVDALRVGYAMADIEAAWSWERTGVTFGIELCEDVPQPYLMLLQIRV